MICCNGNSYLEWFHHSSTHLEGPLCSWQCSGHQGLVKNKTVQGPAPPNLTFGGREKMCFQRALSCSENTAVKTGMHDAMRSCGGGWFRWGLGLRRPLCLRRWHLSWSLRDRVQAAMLAFGRTQEYGDIELRMTSHLASENGVAGLVPGPLPLVGSPQRFFTSSWEDGDVFCSAWHYMQHPVIPHPLLLLYTTAGTTSQAVLRPRGNWALEFIHWCCYRAKASTSVIKSYPGFVILSKWPSSQELTAVPALVGWCEVSTRVCYHPALCT